MKKFSIGAACFRDIEGLTQTFASIRFALAYYDDLHGTDYFRSTEFIAIDNSPVIRDGGRPLEQYMSKIGGVYAECKVQGTSAPRNMVFEVASGEVVLVIDCHLEFPPDAIGNLWKWWEANPGFDGLVHGPLIDDQQFYFDEKGVRRLAIMATHMNDEWRSAMWGTWGRAWQMGEGGTLISVVDKGGRTEFIKLAMRSKGGFLMAAPAKCPITGVSLPPRLPMAGHEKILERAGFVPWGEKKGEVIDIPGHGMGLFCCRRDAWLPFPAECLGFGGEEMSSAELFRKNGRRVVCHSDIPWWHRWFRLNTTYNPQHADTVRNHYWWDKKLQRGLMEVHAHYVGGGLITEEVWQAIMKSPEVSHREHVVNVNDEDTRLVSAFGLPPKGSNLEDVFRWTVAKERDINEHLPLLRHYASQVDRVTEISGRRESTVAFTAAMRPEFTTYQNEFTDGMIEILRWLHQNTALPPGSGHRLVHWNDWNELKDKEKYPDGRIKPTDLLFLDTHHNYDQLYGELTLHAPNVSRWIIRHDTQHYGKVGDDGQPGLRYAIRDFVLQNPEWFVVYHTPQQYGLTVLGRRPEDRPKEEIRIWPKWWGPGTEFEGINKQMGFNMPPGCGCKDTLDSMNEWGVKGCQDNFATLEKTLRERAKAWGWVEGIEKTVADAPEKPDMTHMLNALKSGVALDLVRMDWRQMWKAKSDPVEAIPVMLKLAIKRAEEKGKPAENPEPRPRSQPRAQVFKTIDDLFEWQLKKESDIKAHLPFLKELASECEYVVEFGTRSGVSTTALVAGKPKRVVTVDKNMSGVPQVLKIMAEGATRLDFMQGDTLQITIPECDMLFIDSLHTGDQVWGELTRHAGKVKRWLAFHDTTTFGAIGEDGKPGLIPSIEKFMSLNPEWKILYQSEESNGFLLLTKNPADLP